ncbi:MAG TPA: acyl-homoserine-lactone synthase [Sphingopyxis sp.]|nr:acyl-homoserine-lactone synthase [Sphingopyxis sp.]
MLVVDQSTRAREHAVLRAMFAARKRVFVDLLKWDLPVLAGRFEVDHRDGPDATYLIVAGPEGEHRASARLLPVCPACFTRAEGCLFQRGDRASGIAEVTHFCVSPDIDGDARRHARDQLLHGLVDHALARRIHRLVGIAEEAWARRAEGFGWACRRVGPVRAPFGRNMVTVVVDIDRTTPERLVAAGIVRSSAPRQAL